MGESDEISRTSCRTDFLIPDIKRNKWGPEVNIGCVQDLYHERYSCIAVMFASIPNYKEFYDETDVNKQGLECLRLLNEIICDFDKVMAPSYEYMCISF